MKRPEFDQIYKDLESMRQSYPDQTPEHYPKWLDEAGMITHVWRSNPKFYTHRVRLEAPDLTTTFYLNDTWVSGNRYGKLDIKSVPRGHELGVDVLKGIIANAPSSRHSAA